MNDPCTLQDCNIASFRNDVFHDMNVCASAYAQRQTVVFIHSKLFKSVDLIQNENLPTHEKYSHPLAFRHFRNLKMSNFESS